MYHLVYLDMNLNFQKPRTERTELQNCSFSIGVFDGAIYGRGTWKNRKVWLGRTLVLQISVEHLHWLNGGVQNPQCSLGISKDGLGC